jgi:hypothetical protein
MGMAYPFENSQMIFYRNESLVLEFYAYYENPNLQKNIKNQCFSIWIKNYRSSK